MECEATQGRKALVGKLFYQVSLEELVPAEHLLRRVGYWRRSTSPWRDG